MYNTDYADVIDGVFTYAPKPLIIDGVKFWTNKEEDYISQGWYRKITTPMPSTEGFYYTPTWTKDEDEKTITQGWETHENPTPEPSETELRLAEVEEALCELSELLTAE